MDIKLKLKEIVAVYVQHPISTVIAAIIGLVIGIIIAR